MIVGAVAVHVAKVCQSERNIDFVVELINVRIVYCRYALELLGRSNCIFNYYSFFDQLAVVCLFLGYEFFILGLFEWIVYIDSLHVLCNLRSIKIVGIKFVNGSSL